MGNARTCTPVAWYVVAASAEARPVSPTSATPHAPNSLNAKSGNAVHFRDVRLHRNDVVREVVVDWMAVARIADCGFEQGHADSHHDAA